MNSSITLYGRPSNQQVIPTDNIIRISSEANYSMFFLSNGHRITIAKTLSQFEAILLHYPDFLRPHKSHIINSKFVASYEINGQGGTITLKSGEVLPISRRRGRGLKIKFLNKL